MIRKTEIVEKLRLVVEKLSLVVEKLSFSSAVLQGQPTVRCADSLLSFGLQLAVLRITTCCPSNTSELFSQNSCSKWVY